MRQWLLPLMCVRIACRALSQSERFLSILDPMYNELAPYYNHEFLSGNRSKNRHRRVVYLE